MPTAELSTRSSRSGRRDGLVVAATGSDGGTRCLEAALVRAGAGVAVLRATRVGAGPLPAREGEALPAAGSITPAQARVELMLRLMAEQAASAGAG